MPLFFLDTSFLIALENRDDHHHQEAQAIWEHLLKDPPRFVTTSFVVSEIAAFFNSRFFHDKAVYIGEQLLNSQFVEFCHVDNTLFEESWEFFKIHSDKSYSLTDCISFCLMKKKKIDTALGFDKHFQQANFMLFRLT
jgi:predicted nucleic acid-binding protein